MGFILFIYLFIYFVGKWGPQIEATVTFMTSFKEQLWKLLLSTLDYIH